jgi:hypothetical protein
LRDNIFARLRAIPLAFASLLQRVRPIMSHIFAQVGTPRHLMTDWTNPYIAGAPITEAGIFFGREDVFAWIERSLPGRSWITSS